MAKTVTKNKSPTPTDRLVEAHEEIVRLAAENAALKAAAGPAHGTTPGPRPTTAPGAAPMAPRVPPATPTSPKYASGGKGTAIAAALLLAGLLAGLAISQINRVEKVAPFAPTKVEQSTLVPTEEKKTSAEQPVNKLADQLEQVVEKPQLPQPAEEQEVPQAEPALEMYFPSAHDVEVMCGWKAGRAAGMLPEDRADKFVRCEEEADQPPVADEQQPAMSTQLAGMYQQGQQPRRGCKIPGSVYVDQLGACILRITDPVAVQKILPDREDDPNCRGKPVGFRYDIRIPPRNGMPAGIAHQVCGVRQ